MTIYVVTSGEYSDYGIRAVFLNKEKAEKWAKYHNGFGLGSECEVEEYETKDDDIYSPQDAIRINRKLFKYEWESCIWKPSDLKVQIIHTNNEQEKDRLYFYFTDITLIRKIPTGLSEEEIQKYIDKYKKVVEDTTAKIQYMYEVEGMTRKEIEKIFRF